MPPVIVFSTTSDIEASVVLALLDSQGIAAFRISGNPQAILPMSVSPLGEVRIAVPEDAAEEALRIIESHREDVGARVVRLRDEFGEIEKRIGHRFKDRGLLEHALTHKSRAAEDVSGGVFDNESLEFLGDAVLGLVVADALFRQYPNYTEGQKSKIKASIVSTQALARQAEEIQLGDHLILGRGEEKTGGRFKQALLAAAAEAAPPSVVIASSTSGLLPSALQASIAEWNRLMMLLERQLGRSGAFVAGAAFTLADVVLGLSANRWRMTLAERPALPAIAAWFDRLNERPGFRAHGNNGTP